MTPKLTNIFKTAVLVIVVFGIIWYIYANISDFKQVSLVNPVYLLPLAIFILLSHFSNGLVIKYLLEPFGLKIKFREWFGLAVITNFYNTILPFRSGLIAKAGYLKKKHNFSITGFIAMMAGIYVINFLVAGFIGINAIFLIYLLFKIFNLVVFLIFLGIFIISLGIILFAPKLPESKNKFFNNLIKIINGWHLIKENKKIIFIVSLIAVFQILIGTFSNMVSYGLFGINLGFAKALLLSSIGPLLILVGITPAGLGINEAVSVFLALTMNIPAVQSLPAVILTRVVSIIIIFIIGPIYTYKLLRGMNQDKKNENDN